MSDKTELILESGIRQETNPRPTESISSIGTMAVELTTEITYEEFETLYLLAQGFYAQEVRDMQDVNMHTMVKRRSNIIQKLCAKTVPQAVAHAFGVGIFPVGTEQSTEETSKPIRLSGNELSVLQFAVCGLAVKETATKLGRSQGAVRTLHHTLFNKMDVYSIAHAVWEGCRTRIVVVPKLDIEGLESGYKSGYNYFSLREDLDLTRVPGQNLRARELSDASRRYEGLILDLLDQPDFTLTHPNICAYMQKRHGYTRDQWRNIAGHLGLEHGVIELIRDKPGTATHTMILKPNSFFTRRYKPFITKRVLEKYRHRLSEPVKIDDVNAAIRVRISELSPNQKFALEPMIRVAAAWATLTNDTRFTGYHDLIEALSEQTGYRGEEKKEIRIANNNLLARELLELCDDNGLFHPHLNDDGWHFLEEKLRDISVEVK
jgi:DNA-binding NarL/FixJ family response regulator